MSKKLLLFFLLSHRALASFEIYLKEANQIPLYAQETSVWCGAGSAQMMLEGFPENVNHVYKQRYIWDTIQPLKVETSWYTDPDGLKAVMGVLGGESNWEVRCSKSSAPFMKSLVRNLYDRKYPITVLVYGSAHWIVLIGATTDSDPSHPSAVTLEKVEAHDPWKAQHVLVSGTTWFQKYWYEPARNRSKWNGCYVAVQENTNTSRESLAAEGTVEMKVPAPVINGTVISPEESLKQAKVHLTRIVSENTAFSSLAKQELFEPRLVSHERGTYYLVSIGDKDSRVIHGGLMLNAHTGEWEGLSRFEKTRQHLPEKAADGDWFFTPSQESPSPFFPLYRTRGEGEVRYVDYAGRTFTELHPMVPGS